jgi:hypothetical protein
MDIDGIARWRISYRIDGLFDRHDVDVVEFEDPITGFQACRGRRGVGDQGSHDDRRVFGGCIGEDFRNQFDP